MTWSIDVTDLESLSARLDAATRRLPPQVYAVTRKSASVIRDDARSRVSTHPSWPQLASTITVATRSLAGVHYEAVIGYDDQGQGELAGIAEYGSARKAPHPALLPAFAAERPRYVQALARALGDTIEGAL